MRDENDDLLSPEDAQPVALLPTTGADDLQYLIRNGAWLRSNGFGMLRHVGNQLTHGRQITRLSDVTALPDLWGQAVCFAGAFHNAGQVLHETAIAEWRGLLALLGTRLLRNRPLRIVPVDLFELTKNPMGSNVDGDFQRKLPNFARVVRDSFPSFMALHDTRDPKRMKLDLILYGEAEKEIPIGFTFENTLLVPGRDYAGAYRREDVPWSTWTKDGDGYPLRDPTDCGQSESECLKDPWDKAALAQWLEKIEQGAKKARTGAGLVEQLAKFRNDLNDNPIDISFSWRDISASFDDEAAPNPLRSALFTLPDISTEGVAEKAVLQTKKTHPRASQQRRENKFGHMDISILDKDEGWGAPPDSLAIPLRENLQSDGVNINHAIFLDPSWRNLGADWKKLEIPIIEKSVGDLPSDQDWVEISISKWKADVSNSGYLLMTPDDIFTNDITFLSDELPSGFHPVGMERLLLPFQPIILAFLDPEAIRNSVKLYHTENNSIVVEIFLQTESGTLKGRKTYDSSSTKEINPPDRLTLWPGYVSDIWRHYYLDYWGGKENARIKRVYIPKALRDKGSKVNVEDLTRSLGNEDGQEIFFKVPNSPQHRSCHLLDRPPEAVEFKSVEGLCLLQPRGIETVLPNDATIFKIAIDFGSSGTQILINKGENALNSGPLEASVTEVFSGSSVLNEAPIIIDSIENRYNSTVSESKALLSLLAIRNSNNTKINKDAPRSNTFIPLPSFVSSVHGELLSTTTGRAESFSGSVASDFVFGLKYAGKGGGISIQHLQEKNLQSFMNEACLLSAASAIGQGAALRNINWAFAYPATFLAQDQKRFGGICDEALKAIANPDEGLGKMLVRQKEMILEPYATYKYFESIHDMSDGLMVTVDIGGYSTDVCVAVKGAPVWTGSLALAGQHVLTDYFVYNTEKANQVWKEDTAKALNAIAGKLRDELINGSSRARLTMRADVEMYISEFGLNINDEKVKYEMSQSVKLFYFGLLAYIGMIINSCCNSDLNSGKTKIKLFFGGRGSRLLEEFIDPELLQKACRTFIPMYIENKTEATAGTPVVDNSLNIEKPMITHKNSAKEEVARGLLLSINDNGHAFAGLAETSPLPLGEDVVIANGENKTSAPSCRKHIIKYSGNRYD